MSTTKNPNSKTKKKKRRLCGKERKIYESLKEQLICNDNFNDYTEDLLLDYITMYHTKTMLADDIIEKGVSMQYDNGGGQKGTKNNSNVDAFNRTNAQMLKLLDALGLKPSKMIKPAGDPDDDEL